MDAKDFKKLTAAWAAIFAENCQRLVDMDNVVGDGDIGMVLGDGFAKVNKDAQTSGQTDFGKLVFRCGKVLSAEAPSSMGTLYAIGFMRAGKALVGKTEFGAADIATMMEEIANGIAEAGGAKEGEKTVLDALYPGVRALRENLGSPDCYACGARGAHAGFEAATGMVAKHGRIAFRGNDSIGIADPGAAAAALLFEGIANALS